MDERLRTVALNAGLEYLVDNHPALIEAAWKRARDYAEKLEPLEMTDEPAHVFKPRSDQRSE